MIMVKNIKNQKVHKNVRKRKLEDFKNFISNFK